MAGRIIRALRRLNRLTMGQRVYGAAVMLSALTVALNYGVFNVKQFTAWTGLVIAVWGFSTWTPPKRGDKPKPPHDPGAP